jgi:hypothetical protein
MFFSPSDVYERAQARIGQLAERANDPTLAASDADDDVLEMYLKDALSEISKRGDRMSGSATLTLPKGQPSVDLPRHIDTVYEAAIDDDDRFELEVLAGEAVASQAKATGAQEGRPTAFGTHAGKVWVLPVPDREYTLQLEASLSGGVSFGAGQPDDTQLLYELVEAVPAELERALVAFIVREWFALKGEQALAQQAARRFERGIQRHGDDPNPQTTATRDYNPLSL